MTPTETPSSAASSPESRGFTLTPKEELAVIAQRLKAHFDDCQDARAKAHLEIAIDLVRTAIHRR